MHIYLLKRIHKLLHHIAHILILPNAHLLLLVEACLHRIQPRIVDRCWLDQNALPILVFVLQVGDSHFQFLQIQLVLVEEVTADGFDFLCVLTESILQQL